MSLDDITPDVRRRAETHYETVARSLFLVRGLATPGPDQLGQIVHGAVAGASPGELRAGGSISAAIIGRIDQLITSTVVAGKPRNVHSAEAAQLAQKTEAQAAGMLGFKAFAELQRARAEARAMRESSEGGGGGGSSSSERYASLPASGDRVSPAVMGAYVQSYAGAGLGRGTVQTFAEIGLQRGTYDAYRKEGFSREDIGDAAKTTKTLGWKHDRQAFDDIQRSSRPERKAIVEIHHEKDKGKQDALIARKRRELHIDDKPQKDQDRWNRNIDRVQHHHHDADRRHGIGTSAKQADSSLGANRAAEHGMPAGAKVRVAKLEASETKTSKASAKAMDDGFGTAVAPTKVAGTKPASPGPKTA